MAFRKTEGFTIFVCSFTSTVFYFLEKLLRLCLDESNVTTGRYLSRTLCITIKRRPKRQGCHVFVGFHKLHDCMRFHVDLVVALVLLDVLPWLSV